jgi:hypothetical protein
MRMASAGLTAGHEYNGRPTPAHRVSIEVETRPVVPETPF